MEGKGPQRVERDRRIVHLFILRNTCLETSVMRREFEDDILRDQFSTKSCLKNDKLANLNFQKATKSRYPKCENQKTAVSEQDIGLFAPTSLVEYVENGKTYCFLKSEIKRIGETKKNPFTKEPLLGPLPKVSASEMARRNYPIDSVLFRCPVLRSKDPKIVYIYRNEEVKNEPSIVTTEKGAEFFSSAIGYMYKVLLKEPFISGEPLEVNKIELVAKGESFESEPRPPRTRIITMKKDALKEFMSSHGKDISPADRDTIRIQHIFLDKKLLLYRGLSFDSKREATKAFGKQDFEAGDIYSLTDKRVTSWSTNLCLSASFAASGVYGVVFKRLVAPEEVLIDTRLLHKKELESLYWEDQAEVILLPGTRDVTVELVTRANWNYYD